MCSYSKLFNLIPIGIGTPVTESLSSYLQRLAEGHSVVVKDLFKYEIAPLLEKAAHNKNGIRGTNRFFEYVGKLNGISTGTSEFVDILEALTLTSKLSYLTMTKWENLISPKGLIRAQKAWCPDCLDEWRKDGGPVYEPLLWSIKAVEVCSIHKRRLEKRCPRCGEEVSPDIGYSEALKNSYSNRKTRAIIIDEAQHLSKIAGARNFKISLT